MLNKNKKLIIIILIIAAVLIGGSALIYAKRSADKRSSNQDSIQSISTDQGEVTPDPNVPKASNTPGGSPVASSKEGSSSAVQTSDSSAAPDTPSGAFVSNESVTLSGDRSRINSLCTTTAGAKCTIQFTKDGVTKSLPDTVANSTGHVVWSWTTTDIGLTPGIWKITAIASLNNKTTAANYPLNLEVSS